MLAHARRDLNPQPPDPKSELAHSGRPVNHDWVGKRFRRLLAPTDLSSITMRQLRHSHATDLLRAGVHPKVVQERLGHSSIGVTLNIYISVLPTMQREAVERLVALIDSWDYEDIDQIKDLVLVGRILYVQVVELHD